MFELAQNSNFCKQRSIVADKFNTNIELHLLNRWPTRSRDLLHQRNRYIFFFSTSLAVFNDNTTACSQMVRSRWCNERPMTSYWDCQVYFLPLVVPARSTRQQSDNVLKCLSSKDTFLMNCPTLRDDGTELSGQCNHIKANSRGCTRSNFKCNAHRPVNQVSRSGLFDRLNRYKSVCILCVCVWGGETSFRNSFYPSRLTYPSRTDGPDPSSCEAKNVHSVSIELVRRGFFLQQPSIIFIPSGDPFSRTGQKRVRGSLSAACHLPGGERWTQITNHILEHIHRVN